MGIGAWQKRPLEPAIRVGDGVYHYRGFTITRRYLCPVARVVLCWDITGTATRESDSTTVTLDRTHFSKRECMVVIDKVHQGDESYLNRQGRAYPLYRHEPSRCYHCSQQ